MREYKLASLDSREEVDLRDYETIIEKIVHDEKPDAELTVEEKRYIIHNELSKGEAIRIGRKIAGSKLGQFCMMRPILFVGNNIEDDDMEGEEDDGEGAAGGIID